MPRSVASAEPDAVDIDLDVGPAPAAEDRLDVAELPCKPDCEDILSDATVPEPPLPRCLQPDREDVPSDVELCLCKPDCDEVRWVIELPIL